MKSETLSLPVEELRATPSNLGWIAVSLIVLAVITLPYGLASWRELAAVGLGTFVSEDLTCITAGLLARSGGLDLRVGLAGCFLGIYAGDLGLWLMGRLLGRSLLGTAWARSLLPRQPLTHWRRWLGRRGPQAYLAARFLPGTRLPLYVAAGLLGESFGRFAVWTGLAALAWTPLVVLTVAAFGDAVVRPLTTFLGTAWLAVPAAAVLLYLLVRLATRAATPVGRAVLAAKLARLWRWEFWPTWLFYLPVLPWIGWLALRHRSLTLWTAANPGIPQGGVVGESKFAILSQLPPAWVVPSVLVPPGPLEERLAGFDAAVREKGWQFPLILKPDVGQRGAGLRLAHDRADVIKYLQGQPTAVLVQTYHPGPFEAGVFYYRYPGEPQGRIFSITDKHFPSVTGDGRATLEELIWRHPRYRMQARTFLARHAGQLDRVLDEGESLRLAVAGNHCQGTLFRDGGHLGTPELEQTVDAVARQFPGFYFGRFDVRYHDVAAFRAGRDLAVVELNGVTSESTNIYDPSRSLLAAYRTLYRQWALLFAIGRANADRGHRPAGALTLLRLVWHHYRDRRADPRAD